MQALQTATRNPARVLGRNQLGTIEVGKLAEKLGPGSPRIDPQDLAQQRSERLGVAARSVLVVGPTASFNPGVNKMRQMIVDGEMGPLAMISATAALARGEAATASVKQAA